VKAGTRVPSASRVNPMTAQWSGRPTARAGRSVSATAGALPPGLVRRATHAARRAGSCPTSHCLAAVRAAGSWRAAVHARQYAFPILTSRAVSAGS
jgi:hypothetical protein